MALRPPPGDAPLTSPMPPCCRLSWLLALAMLGLAWGPLVHGQAGTVYRCPGPPVLYTDAISAEEARNRSCRTIEGAPVTVIQGPRPRPAGASAGPAQAGSAVRPGDGRIEPASQRQRDLDARQILESELRREEDKLAALRREFNNGEPERQGNERNYQQYLDRVAQMRAGIQRGESDIAALRRELAKLGP